MARPPTSPPNATTYGYDAAGRLTSLTDPRGEKLVWVYDALGNRLRQENRADAPMTASVQWTYDGAGRILTRQADGLTTSYTYDDNGNRLSATDGTLTISATYDRLNRVLTVDDEDLGSTADTTYTYSLTSPAWTDPTGSYSATLDKFDRVGMTTPFGPTVMTRTGPTPDRFDDRGGGVGQAAGVPPFRFVRDARRRYDSEPVSRMCARNVSRSTTAAASLGSSNV